MASIVACKSETKQTQQNENKEAKGLLQGVWVNGDDGSATMMVKGDTIFYADSTSAPVYFAIIDDSLLLRGSKEVKYAIIKQTENIFQFKNTAGDVIKLKRSFDDEYNSSDFNTSSTPIEINQGQLIKRDSVVTGAGHSYHIYTQVNPTTYKVTRSTYNQDGVSVDNVYYDNIVHIGIFNGASCLFRKDVRKNDLAKYIPKEYIEQGVLSDIFISHIDEAGTHLLASVCIPDTQTGYVVQILVSHSGQVSYSTSK